MIPAIHLRPAKEQTVTVDLMKTAEKNSSEEFTASKVSFPSLSAGMQGCTFTTSFGECAIEFIFQSENVFFVSTVTAAPNIWWQRSGR